MVETVRSSRAVNRARTLRVSARARRIMVILSAALAVAIVALGIMFVNNARYDGASPVPVSERARP